MAKGEIAHADVTTPFRALTFPVLELILITGICGIAAGWADNNLPDPQVHNLIVLVWVVAATWRFLLPVLRARRKRFIVTNRRVIARAGTFRGPTDSIPLSDIVGVRRRRGGISLAIRGYDRALYFPQLPKAKKIERIVDEQLREFHAPIWR